MNWITPESFKIFTESGEIENATGKYQKLFRDMEGLYADQEIFNKMLPEWSERMVYEVRDQRASENPGDLIFGTTVMMPGKVGKEFFMTRGHQHLKAECAETYFGLSGEGVLLMESPEGDIEVKKIKEEIMVYVPPYWIHRSVNTGKNPFIFLFNYPADSGQDYGIIERNKGMRKRIISEGKEGWTMIVNEQYGEVE